MHSDAFDLKALIRPVVDFPKPGVIFRDIPAVPVAARAALCGRPVHRALCRG